MRFSCERNGQVWHGTGRSVDLSRGGVRFLTEDYAPDGAEAELHIHWPFLLQGVIPLELVMQGTILRTDSRGTVMRARNYAFRTCGQHSFHQAAMPERSWSVEA